VQMFRDRWECGHIGTFIFALQAALLVPYIVIGVMGGGAALQALSGGLIPYWLGAGLVALVVMSYVFFGGMRGTAWVNTFQAALFLCFGTAAFIVIGAGLGGFSSVAQELLGSPATAPLLTRERVSPLFFFSYTFIPLSTIAFPHISIFCLTAKKMRHFKHTIVLYPLCLLAVWLPCVFLGVAANAADVPGIKAKLEARQELAARGPALAPEQRDALRSRAAADDVLVLLLGRYAPVWLAGLLGAGIMAAVMASDSQILALSTMFAEDVFTYYGGKARFGEAVQVLTGRVFVIVVTVLAYFVALRAPATIFEIATQYAFAGYAALSPLLVAALFWKRSTKWGALAAAAWTAAAVAAIAVFQYWVPLPRVVIFWNGWEVLARTPGGATVLGLLPVVPITVISALLLVVFSLLTRRPSADTVERYFPSVVLKGAAR